MHFVHDLVLRVGERFHVVVDGCPCPGSAPGVALHEDVLGRAGSSDSVDGGLVETEDEVLVHIVVFIICMGCENSPGDLGSKPGNLLVSKMTRSLEANLPAKCCQKVWKSEVLLMIAPLLQNNQPRC